MDLVVEPVDCLFLTISTLPFYDGISVNVSVNLWSILSLSFTTHFSTLFILV